MLWLAKAKKPNICNVNLGLINPERRFFFQYGGYHFSSHLSLFGGTTTINQPGFINPGWHNIMELYSAVEKVQFFVQNLSRI